MLRLSSFAGILVILGIAWAFSRDRKSISWRVVGWGLGLQLGLALLILHTPPGRWLFEAVNDAFTTITGHASRSAGVVFGDGAGLSLAGILAVKIAAIIIFFASLMGVLYHLGIMQRIVQGAAWIMARTMKTSGAESLACASNVFVGMTEAPLLIRPYLATLTESELMALMTGGFATIAGTVMALYVGFGAEAGHLLTAGVMSAPGAFVIAKLLIPETGIPQTLGTVRLQVERRTVNVVDAAATGATDGLKLALNVIAMLLAFIAILYLLDAGIALIDRGVAVLAGGEMRGWSLAGLFGLLFRPMAHLMGVPSGDAPELASLLGTQVAANELFAYQRLTALPGETVAVGTGILQDIEPRTFVIATYALCGFANFGSVAIQIGGIGALAPERRGDLARLGLRAMAAGALACWLTACVAGLLLSDARETWSYERLLVRKQVEAGRIAEASETASRMESALAGTAWSESASRLRDELGRAHDAEKALAAGRDAEGRTLLVPLAENAGLPVLRDWASSQLDRRKEKE